MNIDDEIRKLTWRDLVRAAERELAMRHKVYPGQIERKKMLEEKATHEIACMALIVSVLKRLEKEERNLADME